MECYLSLSKKRASRGRTIDKWSLKNLYTILSPEDLDLGPASKGAPVGETIGSNPDKIIGRILEVPLSDLAQKYSLIYSKILLKIVDVTGNNAKTKFTGHSFASDYIRSLVKRRRTRIDWIGTVTTKDGIELRLTVTSLTMRRSKTSRKHSIRLEMRDLVLKIASEMDFNEFVNYMLIGNLNSELFDVCRKIYPIASMDIQKSKVLTKWLVH